MPEKTLKRYETVNKKPVLETIPSGVKSRDSENELVIPRPIKWHPEIKGHARALDPETGWRGWVPYTEPQPKVQPKPKPKPKPKPNRDQIKQRDWRRKRAFLREMLDLVELGVFTEEEAGIADLREDVKKGFNVGYL